MPFHLKKSEKMDLLLGVGISLVPLAVGFAGWWLLGPKIILVSLSVAVLLLVLVQLEIFERQRDEYKQVEAMFSLFSVIQPVRPLPPMRDWVISPDFANLLVRTVLDRKPNTILECGGGLSTLLMSYCVIRNGNGHIWSLDHDERYVGLTREMLASHAVAEASTCVHAPLKEISLSGKSWIWYEHAVLEKIGPIDLAIIDGPPKKVHRTARYPALPLLHRMLSDDAVVILDDASRKDNVAVVKMWKEEFPEFRYEHIKTEKGATIIRRIKKKE